MSKTIKIIVKRPAPGTSRKTDDKRRSPKRFAFTCKGCGQESSVTTSSMGRPSWSGLCVRCVRKRFLRKFSGDETHPSGTIIHWSERHKAEFGGYRDHGLVFPSSNGAPLFRQDLSTRMLKPLLLRAELPEEFTPYTLRRTFSSLLRGRACRPRR